VCRKEASDRGKSLPWDSQSLRFTESVSDPRTTSVDEDILFLVLETTSIIKEEANDVGLLACFDTS
jgi:hypothetical protein